MSAAWIEELARPPFREPEGSEARERERLRRLALRAFEQSLPPLYRWARLDSPLLTKRVNLAIPGALPTARSVVFIGPPSIGKTSLAVAMLRARLERELTRTTPESDDDAERIARRYRFGHAYRLGVARLGGPEGAVELQAAIRTPVLVLDNLGAEPAIPSNAIPEVLIERHAEERVIWITTELEPRAIAERYGGGIARRIFENGHVFRLGGAA
ncbi:MAG: hypothetical protein ACRELY_20035 [Polyangiaceae bacterium]